MVVYYLFRLYIYETYSVRYGCNYYRSFLNCYIYKIGTTMLILWKGIAIIAGFAVADMINNHIQKTNIINNEVGG